MKLGWTSTHLLDIVDVVKEAIAFFAEQVLFSLVLDAGLVAAQEPVTDTAFKAKVVIILHMLYTIVLVPPPQDADVTAKHLGIKAMVGRKVVRGSFILGLAMIVERVLGGEGRFTLAKVADTGHVGGVGRISQA